MGEGPQQCPSMTLTPPEISISADIKVPLTVIVVHNTHFTSQTDTTVVPHQVMVAIGAVYLKVMKRDDS